MNHLSRLAAPLGLLAIALMPATAMAQVQTYYHAGPWDAFSGRTPSGGAVCGVGITVPPDNRRLAIRFDIGGTATTFSAGKPDWAIPANTHVRVVMQVGLDTPWTVRATGADDGHGLNWTLDPNAMQIFDGQFRGASSMTLTFPDGNEPPWTLSLTGSSAISDTLGRCVRDLTQQVEAARAQGQPAGTPPAQGANQGATQPFSVPPSRPPAAAPPSQPSAAH